MSFFPRMKNSSLHSVGSLLRDTRNGEKYVIKYQSKDGEKSLVALVIPYHKSKQGKETLATKGEIQESKYQQAENFGDGVVILKSNPNAGLYFTFQKQTRNEKGHWAGNEIRTMKTENIITMEKIA